METKLGWRQSICECGKTDMASIKMLGKLPFFLLSVNVCSLATKNGSEIIVWHLVRELTIADVGEIKQWIDKIKSELLSAWLSIKKPSLQMKKQNHRTKASFQGS